MDSVDKISQKLFRTHRARVDRFRSLPASATASAWMKSLQREAGSSPEFSTCWILEPRGRTCVSVHITKGRWNRGQDPQSLVLLTSPSNGSSHYFEIIIPNCCFHFERFPSRFLSAPQFQTSWLFRNSMWRNFKWENSSHL